MHLDFLRRSLEEQLTWPSTDHAFRIGQSRQPILVAFESPRDATAFLNTRGQELAEERSAVTAAMIAEAQTRESDAWCALLILAYFPGLLRIRSTLKPTRHQQSVHAFHARACFHRSQRPLVPCTRPAFAHPN